MRLPIAVALCFSASTLLADQVTFKNGDRITGTIVKKDADTLVVKSDVFGLVTIPWSEVQTLTANQPVHVVLSDGRTVQGTLTSREQAVEIETAGARQQITLAEITAMRDATEQLAYERLLDPGWGQLWTGAASLGLPAHRGTRRHEP